MKSGFTDPTTPKERKIGKYSFDFNSIPYDDRNKQQAGTNYGVGYKNPVGKVGNPSPSASTLPMGKVETMKLYENE